jgi:hypothetical protein
MFLQEQTPGIAPYAKALVPEFSDTAEPILAWRATSREF